MIRATFERADVALKEQDLTREPNGSPNNYVIEQSGCKDSRTTGEEFRPMRRNSEAIERAITVDELAHWLTVMARVCPGSPKPRRSVHYADMRI